jgi:calcium-dependent protein kinase
LRAVNYTHSQQIAHRDIKPENILVRKRGEKCKVKIIDWGLGTLMGKGKANRVCGTPEYVAPEVLRGSYTLSCDMWSIGAIAYVMLTGEMPFVGSTQEETIEAVMKGAASTNIASFKSLSLEARKFIMALLNKNPEKRMTASEALEHEWLRINASREGEPVFLKETLERLREIKVSNGLSTAVISYVNNHLSTEAEREKLEAIFKHLDANSDGVLSLEELVEGYSQIYGREVGKQIALETFCKLDINHNNSLEFSEFVTFGLRQQKEQEEAKLR